jgi:hypothetical protein
MPVAPASLRLELAEVAAVLVLLVLHRVGGHQPAATAVQVRRHQSQEHQSLVLAVVVVVVIILSALVAQAAAVMAVLTPPVLSV